MAMSALRGSSSRPHDVGKSNHVVDQGGTLSRIDRGTDAKVEGARTRASAIFSRRTSHFGRLLAGSSRRNIFVLTMLFVVCATAVAVAKPGGEVLTQTPDQGSPGLEKVGPINPDTGFPDWYRDRKGKTLEPCLDPKDPMCVLGAIDDPNKPISMTPPPGSPAGTKPNFPDEFFYQSASAGLSNVGQPDDAGKAGKMTAVMSLEGAFANGAPKQGDQMVFGRIRMKVTSGLVSGETYKVVYPYGEQDIQVDAAEHGFFVTEDMGLTPGSFSDALNGRVAPFLHWTADSALPAGYTGIPGTDHTIMGGVNDQNYVMLIGKDAAFTAPAAGSSAVVGGAVTPADSAQCCGEVGPVDGAAVDALYTSLFSLAGKESTRGGLDVTSATYTRDAAGATAFDVRADSKATTPSQ